MDGGKGGEMTAGEDGTYRAKDFKKWLQMRAGEWANTYVYSNSGLERIFSNF